MSRFISVLRPLIRTTTGVKKLTKGVQVDVKVADVAKVVKNLNKASTSMRLLEEDPTQGPVVLFKGDTWTSVWRFRSSHKSATATLEVLKYGDVLDGDESLKEEFDKFVAKKLSKPIKIGNNDKMKLRLFMTWDGEIPGVIKLGPGSADEGKSKK